VPKAKKEFCVYTVPPGQLPARMVRCFKTKKAAQRYTRRERYLQIIPRTRSTVAGRRRSKRRGK
jgi:hypothetical protein